MMSVVQDFLRGYTRQQIIVPLLVCTLPKTLTLDLVMPCNVVVYTFLKYISCS